MTKITYRKDIDGLRAIAVLAVVIFHIEADYLPGGFAGVDMFFVISGFLISRIIITQDSVGDFRFAEFYRRRILRILPVMFFVVLTTLIMAFIVMLPEDVVGVGHSALASVLSGANIYFTYFLDTGYFADSSKLQPLLHLWSLGVEEQFYLLWPATLLLVRRQLGRRWLVGITFVLVAASFILAELLLPTAPEFSYYMLPTRAGQLLMGALAAYIVMSGPVIRRIGTVAANLFWFLGLTLVSVSFILIGETMSFPGINALPITIGTAALLVTGETRLATSRVLMLAPMRYIGKISYSFYLWHWPVLAFWRYVDPDLQVHEQLIALVIMIALSIMSYHLIEQPFRASRFSLARVFTDRFALPTAAVGGAAAVMIATSGFVPFSGSTYAERLARFDRPIPPASETYVCQSFNLTADILDDPACIVGSVAEPTALLWGDSTGGNFVAAIPAASAPRTVAFRTGLHASCPPVLDDPERFVADARKPGCKASNAAIGAILDRYDRLILSGSWAAYLERDVDGFAPALRSTLADLSNKQIIVMGMIPPMDNADPDCSRKALKVPWLACADAMSAKAFEQTRVNRTVEAIAGEFAHVTYIDFNEILCESGSCGRFIDGSDLYYDSLHFSADGMLRFGEEVQKTVGGSLADWWTADVDAAQMREYPWRSRTLDWIGSVSERRAIGPVLSLAGDTMELVSETGATVLQREIPAELVDLSRSSYDGVVFVPLKELLDEVEQSEGATLERLGARHVIVQATIAWSNDDETLSSNPMLRMEWRAGTPQRHDVLIERQFQRGVAMLDMDSRKFIADVDADRATVTMAIALDALEDGRDGAKVTIFPASTSGSNQSYHSSGQGQIELKDLSIYLAQTSDE